MSADIIYTKFVKGNVFTINEFFSLGVNVYCDCRRETGESSHLVCVGGSDNTGIWGYIQCFAELRQQAVEFDDIVCVCGSGGTVSGLAIANYLCGMPYRCHGILVCDSNQYFHEEVNGNLEALGVKDVRSEDIVHLHDAYKEPGYGRNLPCHFEFISQSAVQTGVILDNTYTGKAAYGLRDLMQNKPGVFKGRRILFIHSGWLFSFFCI
ncbi:hypothetical protein EB796_000070 [Bugula neritina]|uniref:Tryptophan synthase beta chain-like PALP domain-containing protein n=1 Tax=Bugula neritina TaxID=10212 RepID=A0A7J7KU41_BUGNE|nr:hypothetical protein EB796_000070 [Bugula neritina]